MTELSPQAEAVLDAADAVLEQGDAPTWLVARGIAAALRAAADRTEHLIGDTPHPKFAEGVLAAGDLLERIADELEGGND